MICFWNMENNAGNEGECPKCHNTGIVKEKDGTCHTCWDCMQAGKLDQHSSKMPESRIKL